MRIKKGFTLAEILIVLMVIGVIATMTIPGLMAGVQEARYKTAYKKAYNNIVNLCAVGRVNGELPVKATVGGSGQVAALIATMQVKGFLNSDTNELDSSAMEDMSKIAPAMTYSSGTSTGSELRVGSPQGTPVAFSENKTWVITEDGFAYTVTHSSENEGNVCSSTLDINAKQSISEAINASCFVVTVDVNGVQSLPNIVEPQLEGEATTKVTSSGKLDRLSGDRYYILIGRDGATSGNTQLTLTGRIVGDVK